MIGGPQLNARRALTYGDPARIIEESDILCRPGRSGRLECRGRAVADRSRNTAGRSGCRCRRGDARRNDPSAGRARRRTAVDGAVSVRSHRGRRASRAGPSAGRPAALRGREIRTGAGRFSAAATPKSPLRAHAAYYAGVSELRLRRFEAATTPVRRFEKHTKGLSAKRRRSARPRRRRRWVIRRRRAESTKTSSMRPAVDVPAIWLSLATAALADGDRKRAADAFLHLYYEFPFSEHAAQAEAPLQTLSEVQPIAAGNTRYKLEMGRGERLFGRGGTPMRGRSFLRLKPHASSERTPSWSRCGSPRSIISRAATARRAEALRPYLDSGPRQAEARFFYLMAHRGLRNDDTFDRARARARKGLSRQHVGRRGAQPSRDVLHPAGSRRRGGRGAARDVRAVPARPLRGACRVEGRMDGVSQGQHGAKRFGYFESASAQLSAIGLSSGMAVLVGTRARGDGRPARRDRAISADDRRLSQHLLRPAGRSGCCESMESPLGPSKLIFAQDGASSAAKTTTFRRPKRRSARCLRAGLVRARREGARVRAREVGRLAGASRRRIAWANKQMAASESGTSSLRWRAARSR